MSYIFDLLNLFHKLYSEPEDFRSRMADSRPGCRFVPMHRLAPLR